MSDRDEKPTLWFVRHGESTWNASGLVQGQAEGSVLTAKGRREAARVAEQLADVAHHRHLHQRLGAGPRDGGDHRARPAAPSAERRALRERNFGQAQGRPLSELPTAASGIEGDRVVDADARPPEGESLTRAVRACRSLHGRHWRCAHRRATSSWSRTEASSGWPRPTATASPSTHGLGPGPQRKCLGPQPAPSGHGGRAVEQSRRTARSVSCVQRCCNYPRGPASREPKA